MDFTYSKEKMTFQIYNSTKELMPQLFDDAFYFTYPAATVQCTKNAKSITSKPFKVDLFSTDNKNIIQAELPGIKKENVKVCLENDLLSIEVDNSVEDSKVKYICKERNKGKFIRSLQLPKDTNFDSASSNFQDGILEITFENLSDQDGKRIIKIQ